MWCITGCTLFVLFRTFINMCCSLDVILKSLKDAKQFISIFLNLIPKEY